MFSYLLDRCDHGSSTYNIHCLVLLSERWSAVLTVIVWNDPQGVRHVSSSTVRNLDRSVVLLFGLLAEGKST